MAFTDRRGVVLLEALVALAVLGMVGGAAALSVSESMRAVAHVHDTEAHLRDTARFLTAVSLWPRADLDRHLGTSRQGPWRLRIDRPSTTLYEVKLIDAATESVLLRTTLFRPDTDP